MNFDTNSINDWEKYDRNSLFGSLFNSEPTLFQIALDSNPDMVDAISHKYSLMERSINEGLCLCLSDEKKVKYLKNEVKLLLEELDDEGIRLLFVIFGLSTSSLTRHMESMGKHLKLAIHGKKTLNEKQKGGFVKLGEALTTKFENFTESDIKTSFQLLSDSMPESIAYLYEESDDMNGKFNYFAIDLWYKREFYKLLGQELEEMKQNRIVLSIETTKDLDTNIESSKIKWRDKKGAKVDLIRLLIALNDAKYFELTDGSNLAPTQELIMQEFGQFLGIDLKDYEQNLSTGMDSSLEANLKFFDALKSKIQKRYLKKDS